MEPSSQESTSINDTVVRDNIGTSSQNQVLVALPGSIGQESLVLETPYVIDGDHKSIHYVLQTQDDEQTQYILPHGVIPHTSYIQGQQLLVSAEGTDTSVSVQPVATSSIEYQAHQEPTEGGVIQQTLLSAEQRSEVTETVHDVGSEYLNTATNSTHMISAKGHEVLQSVSATLPAEFLAASDLGQSVDACQETEEESMVIKVFGTAKATLNTEFVDYISSLNSPSYLHEVTEKHQVSLQPHPSQSSCYTCEGTIASLGRLEKYFCSILFGSGKIPTENSKSIQVDLDKKKGVNKAVNCDIPRPVFSRSGRQVKLKSELYDSDDDDCEITSVKIRAKKNEPPRVVGENGKRKRGRPPKNKPKMIHVDEVTKEISVKEDIVKDKGVDEIDETEEDKGSKEGEKEEIERNDEQAERKENYEDTGDNVLPPSHQAYIQKAKVQGFERPTNTMKDIKKEYEKRMPFKFACDICSFKTKRKSHLIKHKEIHATRKLPLLKCDKCSFTTLRNGHLSRHQMIHSNNVIKCLQCDYKTDSRKHLKIHMKKRHSEVNTSVPNEEVEVHICQICKYETDRPYAMKRHMKTHEFGEEGNLVFMFECKMCPYKTHKKIHFTRHMLVVHSEKRPFLCDTCGRGFKRADALRQHRVVHTAKENRTYNYFCDVCKKGFRSPAHLKEHQTIHSTARPFLCDICGASFKTKSVQKKHMSTLHSNPRAYQCPTCQRRFNTAYALRRHQKSHDSQVGQELLGPTQGMLEVISEDKTQLPPDTIIHTLHQTPFGSKLEAGLQTIEGAVPEEIIQALPESLLLQSGNIQIVTHHGQIEGLNMDAAQGAIQVVMIQGEEGTVTQQVISTSDHHMGASASTGGGVVVEQAQIDEDPHATADSNTDTNTLLYLNSIDS